MIYGIGTDLCAVERIAKSLEKQAFWNQVYAPAEQEMLLAHSRKARTESAAANFAAKEAFLKAAGTGLGGFKLAEIAVLRRPSGAPYYCFSGAAAQWMECEGLAAHLSLTHEGGSALAFAVLEKAK